MNEEPKAIWESFNAPSLFLTPKLIAIYISEGIFEYPSEPLSPADWDLFDYLRNIYNISLNGKDSIPKEWLEDYLRFIKKVWRDWDKAFDPIHEFSEIMFYKEIEFTTGEPIKFLK